MTKYIAKIERTSEKFGGGVKVTVDFIGVRAENESDAKKDFENMIDSKETILYVCEQDNVPAEDQELFNEIF